MTLKISVLLLLLVSAFARPAQPAQLAGAVNVPMPSEVLGFAPGDDRKLASWSQVVDYFEQLDRASDRVIFETLGSCMNKFSDCDWQINAPRSAAMSITTFCLISQTVL